MAGGGPNGGAELTLLAWLDDLASDGVVADEAPRRNGTGGFSPACDVEVLLLAGDDVRDGGGGSSLMCGLGGGGGLGLISACQVMFLLGWLDIWSRVFLTFGSPASATLAALLRSSSIVGIWEQAL